LTFDAALDELMFETVTIEPFTGYTGASRVKAYGAAVTYQAQVLPYSRKLEDRQGKEFVSSARVLIPQRVSIDLRSRITLPTGFVPNTPPMKLTRPVRGLDMDHTEVVCGQGLR